MQNRIENISIEELIPTMELKFQAGGDVEFTITGHSMYPLLLHKVSRIRMVGEFTPKRGDIILYRRDNGCYILHRVVSCDDNGTYTMCGDHQYTLEKNVRRDQMIGCVTAFTKNEQWISCDDATYTSWWKRRLFNRYFRKGWGKVKDILRPAYHLLFKKNRSGN